jgi:hypothetical protein
MTSCDVPRHPCPIFAVDCISMSGAARRRYVPLHQAASEVIACSELPWLRVLEPAPPPSGIWGEKELGPAMVCNNDVGAT